KTAIGFPATGLAVGVYMRARREPYGRWPHPYQVSAHTHAILVGSVMFLILDGARRLLPRAAKEDARYRPERIEAAYWILTVSTATRFLGEIARVGYPGRWLAWAVFLGGLGQAVGLLFYFWTMWTRVRPVGS